MEYSHGSTPAGVDPGDASPRECASQRLGLILRATASDALEHVNAAPFLQKGPPSRDGDPSEGEGYPAFAECPDDHAVKVMPVRVHPPAGSARCRRLLGRHLHDPALVTSRRCR